MIDRYCWQIKNIFIEPMSMKLSFVDTTKLCNSLLSVCKKELKELLKTHSKSEGCFSPDLRSADKELKAVTPDK